MNISKLKREELAAIKANGEAANLADDPSVAGADPSAAASSPPVDTALEAILAEELPAPETHREKKRSPR
jgi:hypothetical protein